METLLIRSDFLTKTLKDPVNLLLIALLAVLSYLILWPFFELILQTITWVMETAGCLELQSQVSIHGSTGYKLQPVHYHQKSYMNRL